MVEWLGECRVHEIQSAGSASFASVASVKRESISPGTRSTRSQVHGGSLAREDSLGDGGANNFITGRRVFLNPATIVHCGWSAIKKPQHRSVIITSAQGEGSRE